MVGRRQHIAPFCRANARGSAILLGLGVLLTSLPAAAQNASYRGTPEQQQACTDDVFRLCNQFVPDEPRIIACLQANQRSLSALCKQVFREAPAAATPAKRSVPR
jgi:hypothetical protein